MTSKQFLSAHKGQSLLAQNLMKIYKLQIGAMYRGDIKKELDRLSLPYQEDKGIFDTFFIIAAPTPEDEAALALFIKKFRAFTQKLAEFDREEEQAKQERKLNRRNRFRRLTFRQPLGSL